MENKNSLIHDAIKLWGVDSQLDKAIEELAELIVTISHARLNSRKNEAIEKIAEEIVDVRLMLEQLVYIYQIDISKLRGLEILKLDRLEWSIYNAKQRNKSNDTCGAGGKGQG